MGRDSTAADARAAPARAAATAVLGLVVSVLPVFLMGALAVLVRRDLRLDEAQLGGAVAVFFSVAALAAVPGGRVVQRVGWRAGMAAGSVCSLVTLLAIAALADSWTLLAVLLAVGGLGVAFVDPAANLALARELPERWQSRGFGLKEAAIPAATLIGGGALPLLGLTVGWRWAFAGSTLLVVALWALLLARTPAPVAATGPPAAEALPRGDEDVEAGPVTVLAIAAACGVAAATCLGVFLVDTAVAAGLTPSTAGALLAVGSVAGIVSRLLSGWATDRFGGRALRILAWMLLSGAAGFAALASGRPEVLLPAVLLGFAGGWGWTGLLYYAVVRARRADPARASGVVLLGLATGAIVGPLGFGALARATSLRTAWLGAAVLALAAAALTPVGARRLHGGTRSRR